MEKPARNPLEHVFEAPVTQPGQRPISFMQNLKKLNKLLKKHNVSPVGRPSHHRVLGRPAAHKVTFKSKSDLAKIKLHW